ncbi:DUF3168 domain-containing protein [Falsirhodobacter sp. 20TX0035]|uniref:DUF3168 domain-containing protein n=1 Tax=Falsirhodobacter sp. 20TX0035 TaxID=3022019 RepID=UPI0023306536|nr:DUF3168 domain-containing protein [Falsirhodobacter sp. 20TX0035]MDB6455014.1 DUF3168 domain-containing protein [Falsirhodobacter sp. 20TX0035]
MDRIIAQVPALEGRVYDRATEGTSFPSCTLGPSYWTDASVECVTARQMTLQIDIWHSQANKGVVEDLVDDVTAALAGWSDPVRITMRPLVISLVRVLDEPGDRVHGVVQVEALLEG